jgi:hypothetical protein
LNRSTFKIEVETLERRIGKQLGQALSTGGPLVYRLGILVLRLVGGRECGPFKQRGSVGTYIHLARSSLGSQPRFRFGAQFNLDSHGNHLLDPLSDDAAAKSMPFLLGSRKR